MTKIAIYAGIILAFLAVPIGSYFIVKHYASQVVELQQKNARLENQNQEFANRIEFDDKIENATKNVEPEHEAAQEQNVFIGKQIDDLIRETPSTDVANENMKKTLKALKEIAE
ncbi:hypothetical protein EVB81_106 [Rhizobium phage RHph_I46]|uniref:Uncharacterized protein n=1 Tax=Rhizobium phage RHph_I1_9 TaxID=2509729 RepID=A0A7S5R9F5_9CAUD|nr:hypothetical protein PP936_gp105 [Rhizobium phage RHph_I1_9]QIG69675.1 hypothetical protein EVB81_106 [Rhizobium phage RHph_I46]QIG70956.1 hypothetical protein EVB92_106 [Rhizobium phage RHph_I9]QIG73542.1 hypothetical protein EVC04_105 [Rhizobium phage RHph_I1_9]QIG76295.1 hypothetical protein EVC25_106 [Rhizobium phage RHph_I34]